jgi:glycosyltransferase involved in cell wall biosynthesis
VIPNGLEINDNNISKQNSTTFFDNFRTERPVIGTVSRLDPIKNQMLFIHMARQMIQQGYEADFWIIGEGPMRTEIESAIEKYNIKNYVKLFGYRTDIDIALSKMDVFVLTSNSEGCPNVVLEAMRASLPIVSTNCSSLEQIVEQGINGYTVPVGDLTALVEKVQFILSNPEKRKALGMHSLQIIKQRFELSIIVKQFEQVYLNCLTKLSRKHGQLKKKLRALELA